MQRQLCFAPEVLHIRPWPDDVIDHMGHDPRSAYVEDYWLGLLGPSTTWLLRRLAAGFEYSPEGFDLDLLRRHGPLASGTGVAGTPPSSVLLIGLSSSG